MYQLHSTSDGSTVIFQASTGYWIPTDPENTDYQQYLAWVEEGNTPEVIDPTG